MKDLARAERGFAIVAAVFILVVLAGLGAFLVSTSTTQHQTLALDVMNARAHQAARTGIEWGVYQVVKLPAGAFTSTTCNASYAAPVSVAPPISGLPGLDGFTIVVSCGSQQFTEGADTYRVYQITATACNAAACPSAAPGAGYVEHQQRTRVKMP